VELLAPCPRCAAPASWEIDLRVDRELGWAAPDGPRFLFRCPRCDADIAVALRWTLDRGSDPRPLRLVGGPTPSPPTPCILLVDRCPHGCGAKLGLQLDPQDPWTRSSARGDASIVAGGYRCPRCDGEGRLRLQLVVSLSSSA
jgi:hypothetical protein